MTGRGSILVVDDEDVLREELAAFLADRNCLVRSTADGAEALDLVRGESFDVVISDLRLPGVDGLAILDEVRRWSSTSAFILITAHSSVRSAVEAFRRGASDYVVKPIVLEDVLARIDRLVAHRRLTAENQYLRKFLEHRIEFGQIVSGSPAMTRVLDLVRRVGPLDSLVLVTGESGTGKERIVRAIHDAGPRRDGPFLAVNCGALPESLFESTLFGHLRGAFTGASEAQEGLFRGARGGTLFLDEIGTVPLEQQSKLLRVLEEKQVLPVGGTKPVATDARVVAATNDDLEAAVEAGRFRADLFYRLNVFPIVIPPLRERTEDIPELVDHFIRRFNLELGLSIRAIEREALHRLSRYGWKGNVRELQNVVQRAMILATGDTIRPADLPPLEDPGPPLEDLPLAEAVKRFERSFIERALERHGQSRQETSRVLGISPTTLWRRIRELGIGEEPGAP